MKHSRILLVITVLVLASLACNAISRIGSESNDVQLQATEPVIDSVTVEETVAPPPISDTPISDTGNNNSNATTTTSKFPVTSDAFNIANLNEDSLVYYTKMSADEIMKFYRDEYTAKGYKEREMLTTVFEGGFSMVFDGDPSGKAIAIQSVDMGDGSRTVSINLVDL